MTYFEHVGTAQSLSFGKTVYSKTAQRGRTTDDRIPGCNPGAILAAEARQYPEAGYCVFHDFWIDDEQRIIILEINEFQHKQAERYPVKKESTRPLNTFKVLALAGVV